MKQIYIFLVFSLLALGGRAQQVEFAFNDIGPDPNNPGNNLLTLNIRASTGYNFGNGAGGWIAGFNLRVDDGSTLTASSYQIVSTASGWALGISDWDANTTSFNAAAPYSATDALGAGWLTVATISYPSSAVGVSITPKSITDNPPSFWADGSGNAQPFTISPYVLPVNLTAFTVSAANGGALLSWTTAQEINNKGFGIERSTDSRSFSSVGFVASQATNGNSSYPLTYTFTDPVSASGTYYYRLKQEDQDGKTTYSDVRSITLNGSGHGVQIAPNPVSSSFNLSNTKVGATYKIYSMDGKLLKAALVTASSQQVDVSTFVSGVYILQVQDESGTNVSLKFLKK
ncbi:MULTISPECIES: T9SS type A sorting domain-containing protein [Chitinophagaceae]